MGALSAIDRRRTHEAIEVISTLRLGDGPFLPKLPGLISSLWHGAPAMLMVIGTHDSGFALTDFQTHGLPAGLRSTVQPNIDGARVPWGLFNPARPEAKQRNVLRTVRTTADGQAYFGGEQPSDARPSPMVADLLERHGYRHQLRVLLCDGPALLAWVGSPSETAHAPQQHQTLRALIHPLVKRLRLERALTHAPLSEAVSDAVWDAMPGAAFVLSAGGRIRHANVAGRHLLAHEPLVHGWLSEALRGKRPEIEIVPLVSGGVAQHFLARVTSPASEAVSRAAVARLKFGLTVRQQEIVAYLLRGQTNASIAAALRCSESTVEAHVTALLSKVGVCSRSELVAQLWSQGAGAAPRAVGPRLATARMQWKLTPREAEVLAQLVRGPSNHAIAQALGCAEGTIEAHVSTLLDKAGAANRAALVARFWCEL